MSLALLIITAVWSLHLVLSYFLAWLDCVAVADSMLLSLRHLTTVLALGVTVVAWIYALRGPARRPSSIADGRESQELMMEHGFLGTLTVLLSAMFLFAIVLAGAANFFLRPCV
jgi:hypothetical protein